MSASTNIHPDLVPDEFGLSNSDKASMLPEEIKAYHAEAAAFRAQALNEARAGRSPSYHPVDFKHAYGIRPDGTAEFAEELDELSAARQAAEQAKAERVAAAVQRRELAAETKTVLAEWHADRQQAAEAEARKRLGWTT